MNNEKWVDINNLSDILGVLKETLRRNCLAYKYIFKTQKAGKFKHYQILVSSLPLEYQDKYNKFLVPNDNNLDFEIYSNAPEWARKQADKYLNLINQTAKMSYKQVKAFLSKWDTENPNNAASYQSLMRAKK